MGLNNFAIALWISICYNVSTMKNLKNNLIKQSGGTDRALWPNAGSKSDYENED